MKQVLFISFVALICSVVCKPLEQEIKEIEASNEPVLKIHKRFINPMFAFGDSAGSSVTKMRTKRSEDDCERLSLCKLHARSRSNFFSAFQLYFVNKENARQWDHQSRSLADCERRFGDCYE